MVWCYLGSYGCSQDAARSLALGRVSAGEGSKYRQRALGRLYQDGVGGVAQDRAAAVAQYRPAAAQGVDAAQNSLGYMYDMGYGVTKDNIEALRWYKLAAAQGRREALYSTGSAGVMSTATVLLPTGRRRFAGTSVPLQRATVMLYAL